VNDAGDAMVSGFGHSHSVHTVATQTTDSMYGSVRWLASELLVPSTAQSGLKTQTRVSVASDTWAFAMTTVEVSYPSYAPLSLPCHSPLADGDARTIQVFTGRPPFNHLDQEYRVEFDLLISSVAGPPTPATVRVWFRFWRISGGVTRASQRHPSQHVLHSMQLPPLQTRGSPLINLGLSKPQRSNTDVKCRPFRLHRKDFPKEKRQPLDLCR
jgi:hypothetical protein